MKVEKFVEILQADFFTGVPDSQLKALCNYLYNTYKTDSAHHMICANEGNCVALAAGYHYHRKRRLHAAGLECFFHNVVHFTVYSVPAL